jgi:hypothetical protein
MTHLTEEELVLHYYREAEAPAGAEAHLRECAECAGRFAALEQVLASVITEPVPERGPEYGAQVWQRIQGQVIAREPQRGFSWSDLFGRRPLALAGAMVVLLIAAFYAGRLSPRTPDSTHSAANAEQVRERILVVAVGEHLERSRLVLAELVNSPDSGTVNLASTQTWAEDLVESNRLYRKTAAQAGDKGLTSVLDELERTLLEVAHSPKELSQSELDLLRKRIESKGILFKLKVVEGQMQQRQQQSVASSTPGKARQI